MLRTNTCGELSKKELKKKVSLCGWVHSRRDHGGVIFIDLRDRYGLTQIVFDPSHNKEVHKMADKLRREDVIQAKGAVRSRTKGMANPKLKTGEIEVIVSELKVFNKSEVPPIEIDDRKPSGEDTRMKYRYLDLRRPSVQEKFVIRHKTMQVAREFLSARDFLEIETPMLIKPTPEGARDYIVPSRVHPGKFYSLPQSPQLYKQILMVAGFDRYFQFPRCLRDEDLRSDRQPEHTQLDVEMCFAEQEDIFELTEELMEQIFKKVLNVKLKTPFLRMTYDESMLRYGNDKPDLRFGLELKDVTSIVKGGEFKVFKEVAKNKGIVKGILVPRGGEFSRKKIDTYLDYARSCGAGGMVWMKVSKGVLESNVAKFFSEKIQKELIKTLGAKEGDMIFLVGDSVKVTNGTLSRVRQRLGQELNLINEKEFNFCIITDFPLFEWNSDEEKWDPMHHIFTAPREGDLKYLEKDPSKVYGQLYDLVLNGTELYSGSIRNSNVEIQERMMKVIGMSKEEAKDKFGFLLEAYRYGGPVHAGFGLGFDRLVALMCGTEDIREVIAFPKSKSAENLMDGCPLVVDQKELKEVHIELNDFAKKSLNKK
ncbi:aspartate--tRNA ligase [Candidatus Woesearchaeota archaeon]|jgi:aspartyl-tRNA synthetase|nr:aspartate--tRNA ligase [Candidatus Woesearchaeota archaeon]